MSEIKILLVEDEVDFGFILKQYLEMSGFEVFWYQNPLEVLDNIETIKVCTIAILDVMMPDMDGFTLSRKLGEFCSFPFLFLTAKNQQMDRILGLKLGADDYVAKPCDPEELILRIQNILKRKEIVTPKTYNLGDYLFLPSQLLITHKHTKVQLTEREARLLLLLIEYNNRIITREIILQNIWNATDYFSGRSMDVFISRLRKYFQYDEGIKIQSIRGVGFQVYFPI